MPRAFAADERACRPLRPSTVKPIIGGVEEIAVR